MLDELYYKIHSIEHLLLYLEPILIGLSSVRFPTKRLGVFVSLPSYFFL